MTDDNDTNDPVEEFKEALPQSKHHLINEIKVSHGKVRVELKGGKKFGTSATEPLLEGGFVTVDYHRINGRNRFSYKRLAVEEREVERTIVETETVATTESV